MKVLATAGDIDATIAHIRLRVPLTALQCRQPTLMLRWRSFHDCRRADLDWADVLVVQRGLDARAWALIEQMKAGGGRVVYEIDDLLTDPPPTLRAHAQLAQAQPWLRRSLAAADLCSVSTPRLGRALDGLVRRWHWVPNHGAAVAAHAGVARAGAWPTWLLASSDHVALGPLADALRALQAGGGGQESPRVVAVGPVADDLQRAGVAVQAEPPRSREDFLAFVASLPDPVALVPLGHTPFDACKSAVKYFDLALLGVPVLAGDRPPYADVIEHGVDGLLLPDTATAWADALAAMQRDPALGPRLATAARRKVQADHSVEHAAAAWHELLSGLPAGERRSVQAAPWRQWGEALVLRLRQANRRRLQARQRARDERSR